MTMKEEMAKKEVGVLLGLGSGHQGSRRLEKVLRRHSYQQMAQVSMSLTSENFHCQSFGVPLSLLHLLEKPST